MGRKHGFAASAVSLVFMASVLTGSLALAGQPAQETPTQAIQRIFKVTPQEGVTVAEGNAYGSSLSFGDDSWCVVAVARGKKQKASCWEHHASSDILGGLLFLGTLGNLGSAGGSFVSSTTCDVGGTLEVLVRDDVAGSSPVLERVTLEQQGSASVEKIKWFQHGLKKNARRDLEQKLRDAESELAAHAACPGWGVVGK